MANSGGQVGWDDVTFNFSNIVLFLITHINSNIPNIIKVTVIGKRGPRSGTTLKSQAVNNFKIFFFV